MNVEERFFKYIGIESKSLVGVNTIPSSKGQKDLATVLADELNDIGVDSCAISKDGIVYAYCKSNVMDCIPSVGFVSHLDTYPLESTQKIEPIKIERYRCISQLNSYTKKCKTPYINELKNHIGESIIISKNENIVGVDNKAGIAEIMTAIEEIVSDKMFHHGDIYLAFVPDEEIGKGSHLLNKDVFKCQYAFVIDGNSLGDVEVASMASCVCFIKINGQNAFLGDSNNILIDAIEIAFNFIEMIPNEWKVKFSSGKEGFISIGQVSGSIQSTTLSLCIMDFYEDKINEKYEYLKKIKERLNASYGKNTVSVFKSKISYQNIEKYLQTNSCVVNIADLAFKKCHVEYRHINFRGCTDASIIFSKGIPATTLGVGGGGFHSKYEWVSIQDMERMVDVIKAICEQVTTNNFFNESNVKNL